MSILLAIARWGTESGQGTSEMRYWKLILLFGGILAIYTICCSPAFTWAGLDTDCFNFVHAAKFMKTPHAPGYPTWTLLAIVADRIPLGSEGWRLSFFMSVLPLLATCALVFLIVRKLTTSKWAPYVATLALAGCNAVLMQSIIPEVYAISMLCMTATFAAYVWRKEKLCATCTGLTAGTQVLLIPAAVLLLWKCGRRYWYIPLSITVGLYSYIILSNPHYIGFMPFLTSYVWGQTNMALSAIPERTRDFFILLCTGFGLALLPAILWLKDIKRSWVLWAISSIPVIFFFSTYTPVTYAHMVMAFPFLAVAAGLGIEKLKFHPAPVLIVSAILLAIMPFHYDIGNNLDRELSAQRFYEEMQGLPENSLVLNYVIIEEWDASGIDERVAVPTMILNELDGVERIPINLMAYTTLDWKGENYRKSLRELGLKTPIFAIGFLAREGVEEIDLTKPAESSPYHQYALAIAQANPDRETHYFMIPKHNIMCREPRLMGNGK